jgi:EAL domain-containing protein (putative c-di-GMP-specific phosphodiesterase class I)
MRLCVRASTRLYHVQIHNIARPLGRTCYRALRRALQRGEFFLAYPLQVSIASRDVLGVEALLCWRRSEQGVSAPGDFVPVLEETGLIVDVGEWVLYAACRQLGCWREQGITVHRVAVNISPRQLGDSEFLAVARCVLAETGTEAAELELEITESSLMEDECKAIETLHALGRLGVGIAMDDFGTGYSSLSYLRRLPLRLLKVDLEFVGDVPDDVSHCELARAIAAMGNSLNVAVLAEGGETPEQFRNHFPPGRPSRFSIDVFLPND